jgi:phosphatidylethanolamine-binding protein (PEBP) family uncharacterized protein
MRTLLPFLIACSAATEDPVADTDADVPFVLEIVDLEDASDAPRADECDLALPVARECRGTNPEVRWSGAPAGTAGFVLLFDDPDSGDFPHWGVYDLPADATGIPADRSGADIDNDVDGTVLVNGFGWEGYLGSCPGSANVYRWVVWAVDDTFSFTDPGTGARAAFDALREAARDASLARANACHLYGPAVNP